MDQLSVAQEKEFESAFGKVTAKIPSAMKQVQIGRRMQQYAGGLAVDAYTWNIIEAFATLDICLISAPFKKDEKTGGYDWDSIDDVESLLKLSGEVKDWIDSFRKSLRKES